MSQTGWGGFVGGEPGEEKREYIFLTCDCDDFVRGINYGMEYETFERRKPRMAEITIAEQDDIDAITYLWDTHNIIFGEMFPFMMLDGKLAFRRSHTAYRIYILTKTFKPYKRKEGGKTSYHLVMATPDAIEPTDFVCKHIMRVAVELYPGTDIVWISRDTKPVVHISNLIALEKTLDKAPVS